MGMSKREDDVEREIAEFKSAVAGNVEFTGLLKEFASVASRMLQASDVPSSPAQTFLRMCLAYQAVWVVFRQSEATLAVAFLGNADRLPDGRARLQAQVRELTAPFDAIAEIAGAKPAGAN
jgi:hypothetical protein